MKNYSYGVTRLSEVCQQGDFGGNHKVLTKTKDFQNYQEGFTKNIINASSNRKVNLTDNNLLLQDENNQEKVIQQYVLPSVTKSSNVFTSCFYTPKRQNIFHLQPPFLPSLGKHLRQIFINQVVWLLSQHVRLFPINKTSYKV